MKRVLITGASSGVGAAVTRRFLNDGWFVFGAARRCEVVEELIADAPNEGRAAFLDLANPDSIDRVATSVSSAGSLHALVHCAGILSREPFEEIDDDTWRRHFDIAVVGPARLTRGVADALKDAKGRIVVVSSVMAQRPYRAGAAYGAAKAAMEQWARVLALEWAPFGVNVNVVAPGGLETPMQPEDAETRRAIAARHPLGRMGRPDEVATIAAMLCDEQSDWITGSVVTIDGGLSLLG